MNKTAPKWAHDLLDRLAQNGLTGESVLRWYEGGVRENYKIIIESKKKEEKKELDNKTEIY